MSVLVFSGPVLAGGLDFSSGNWGASFREVGAGIKNYSNDGLFGPDNGSDYYSETILRITEANLGSAGLGYFETHLVGGMVKTSMVGQSGLGGLSQSSARQRYRSNGFWPKDRIWNEKGALYHLNFDRLNLKSAFKFGDVTVGRQAITFGETYFWNPLDVFNPFDARSFDRDYKPGVEVIRFDAPLGDFAGMNIIVGFYGDDGEESDYKRHVFLYRCYGDVDGWDMSVQGGQIYGGNQLGGGLSGEALSLEVRGEAVWFKSKIDDRVPFDPNVKMLDDSFTGVFGLGRKVADKFTVEAEYLYNGAGLPENLNAGAARVGEGDALHMGRHLIGLSLAWEAMPLLNLRFACLGSFSDGSRVFQPGFTYSLSNEAELVAGSVINLGKRPGTDVLGFPRLRSEFGTNPDAYYLEMKMYF